MNPGILPTMTLTSQTNCQLDQNGVFLGLDTSWTIFTCKIIQVLWIIIYMYHFYTLKRYMYIVQMEFCVNFFPRISAFSRRTKMHLNGILLIETEFFKIIVPLQQPPISW